VHTQPNPSRRLPVTVVTGFLGAGKTTLLRHLLLHSGRRLAVLVNEFGEVGIDGDLLRSCGFCAEEELDGRLVELTNGCLCCTVQDDFLPTMERLLEHADRLDGIVVETSGLALPEPLVAAFGWPAIRARTRVDGVLAVVDGEALAAGAVVADPEALERQRQADPSLDHATAIEALFDEQIEAADLVLVSRADRIDGPGLERVRQRLARALRPGTPVLPVRHGQLDPAVALGIDAPTRAADHAADEHPPDDEHHPHPHDHAHVAMEAMAVRLAGDLERSELEAALTALITAHGLVRVKGRLRLRGKALALQIQAAGPRLLCWFEGRSDPGAGPGLELVLMGFQLDRPRIEAQLAALVQRRSPGA